jgi:transposase
MRGSERFLSESNRTRRDVGALTVIGGVKSSITCLSIGYGGMWCFVACRYFFYQPKEILCPTHGRVQENIVWAEAYARITYRLEYIILVYCQLMTQKAAAQLLHIAKSTLSDLLHRTIERLREGHRIKGLRSVGVDEVSYCKGRKFATIVYDLDRHCVVWVGKGKGRETIDLFFYQELSPQQRSAITSASCDMSQAYMGAIKHYCPNAALVLDHFHIVKALLAAVDEVRKEEWRKADKSMKVTFKGLRWLLFLHSSNRTKWQTRLLNQLKKGNRHIHRAWVLKDEFEQFWQYVSTGAAEMFLKGWMTAALKSRLQPLREFVNTLKKHWEHILAYINTPITNAVGEGINRIIKIVKNRASGYRTLDAFTDMIYLTVGDVNIPEQIPACFRTL